MYDTIKFLVEFSFVVLIFAMFYAFIIFSYTIILNP